MCGRVDTHDRQSIYEIMRRYDDGFDINAFDARYNVAPGAKLPALYYQQQHRAIAMHWGLIPLWAKPDTFKQPLINARAETIFEKPSFRSLIKQYRCAVAVNGFYEWQRQGDKKQPYYFHPANSSVILLAAIFQFDKQGAAQCCLITTSANDLMQPVHNRMPVVISETGLQDWLQSDDRSQLQSLMQPADDKVLQTHAVSTYVSNAGHDGERCIAALAE